MTGTQMNTHTNDWWRGAVIYQIYPRSFMDSNNDGIGDIAGIISRLDYIRSLNVDAIWLSPFFTSPMKDFGYDVADYRDVDPMFGNLADFKELINQAHERGLKVIIDQVYSHSSDQCQWFQESRANKTNDKADWYVWADAKPDGTPPNNWLSLFGGSAWQWDTSRKQYFLHNFLASQPDLNFHSEAVQQEVLETAKFWLELGVDGFRLDVVNMYFHNETLADNPLVSKPEEQFVGVDSENPFCRQYHINQMCRDDNLEFLKRLRTLLDTYPGATTVGEIGAPDGMSYMAQYTSGGDKLHMAYTFELLGEQCDPPFLRKTLQRVESKLADGWASFALSNHDVVRSATRWTKDCSNPNEKIKAMLTLLLTQRGTPCLYQGEELGLPEGSVPFESLQDPFGIEFWPDFKGRDGCRTPMPWDNSSSLGFSKSEQPWLPYQKNHADLAAETQTNSANSTLPFVQRLLAWRGTQTALKKGSITWLDSEPNLLLFSRINENQHLKVAINLTETAIPLEDDANGKVIWGSAPDEGKLQPYQCCIWLMND
jgi:alpha-glucosidase